MKIAHLAALAAGAWILSRSRSRASSPAAEPAPAPAPAPAPTPAPAPAPVPPAGPTILGTVLVPGQRYRARMTVYWPRSWSHGKVVDKLSEHFDGLTEYAPNTLPANWPADERPEGDGKWTFYGEGVYRGGDAGDLPERTKDFAILGVWPA